MEFDVALLLFEVSKHLCNDFEIAFVHHARPDEAEVDMLLATVIVQWTNGVMRVPFGYIFIVDVWIGNHWLIDDVEVHLKFSVVLRIVVRSQGQFFA